MPPTTEQVQSEEKEETIKTENYIEIGSNVKSRNLEASEGANLFSYIHRTMLPSNHYIRDLDQFTRSFYAFNSGVIKYYCDYKYLPNTAKNITLDLTYRNPLINDVTNPTIRFQPLPFYYILISEDILQNKHKLYSYYMVNVNYKTKPGPLKYDVISLKAFIKAEAKLYNYAAPTDYYWDELAKKIPTYDQKINRNINIEGR